MQGEVGLRTWPEVRMGRSVCLQSRKVPIAMDINSNSMRYYSKLDQKKLEGRELTQFIFSPFERLAIRSSLCTITLLFFILNHHSYTLLRVQLHSTKSSSLFNKKPLSVHVALTCSLCSSRQKTPCSNGQPSCSQLFHAVSLISAASGFKETSDSSLHLISQAQTRTQDEWIIALSFAGILQGIKVSFELLPQSQEIYCSWISRECDTSESY